MVLMVYSNVMENYLTDGKTSSSIHKITQFIIYDTICQRVLKRTYMELIHFKPTHLRQHKMVIKDEFNEFHIFHFDTDNIKDFSTEALYNIAVERYMNKILSEMKDI